MIELIRSTYLGRALADRTLRKAPTANQGARMRNRVAPVIILAAMGCPRATDPTARPELPDPGTRDRSLAELSTTHRLLRMQADLVYSCNGKDGDSWYARHARPLDSALRHANTRIAEVGVTKWDEATPRQVLDAMQAIDKALHESGFAICVRTQLLSDAFGTPTALDREDGSELHVGKQTCHVLRDHRYRDAELRKHWRTGLRPIDCDLASFIYMTIGESQNWPLEFIEVPGHNFVRWRFADGTHLNWDPNDAQQYSDEDYRRGMPRTMGPPFDEATESAGRYLVARTPEEIDGYYMSLFVTDIVAPKCIEDAYRLVGTHDGMPAVVYNNLAWAFATLPALQGTELAGQATRLARLAVGKQPKCNYWDTLSCAYAAEGAFEKALEVERTQISTASRRIAAYAERRTCYEKDVAEAGGCSLNDGAAGGGGP
jgi:hypothetical protein